MTGRDIVVHDGDTVFVSESYVEGGELVAGQDLMPELKAHWGDMAAHYHAVAAVAISTALDAVDEPEDLMSSFDALPGAVQVAVFDQLAAGTVGKRHVKLSGEEAGFLDTSAGRYLRERWGSGNRAEFKIAQALKRIDHILDNLNDADAETAANWLKTLPPEHEAAIWIALAEG